MALAPGFRVGAYEVIAPIGRGGMGEVYRARDLTLHREVAIKTLPEAFERNPERLVRFEREGRLLATLSHPNIAAIHGFEERDGVKFLVMELVEGQGLDTKIAAGPLPVAEALAVAAQVAAGLEAAHDAGIIHRDLKPSNVLLRSDGAVKILDFGLARAVEPAGPEVDASLSPTLATPATSAGVVLGTAAYMSPEQARGKPLDKKSDIFSFGCLLYECLTGKQAFAGETMTDILSAILTAEPDWSALPAATPSRVRELLRRCLQKDSRRRLHDIADARIELEEAQAATETGADLEALPQFAAGGRRTRLPWLAAGALLGAAAAAAAFLLLRPSPRPDVRVVRAVLPLPSDARVRAPARAIAISPDGRTIVFRAVQGGVARLYRRVLDGPRAEPIQGTAWGNSPFFSPDGQWLGFFTGREIRKVPIVGGAPVSLCPVPPVAQGASWGSDGRIVFAPMFNSGLYWVPESGGEARPLTRLDASGREHGHLFPHVLPRGAGILATRRQGRDFQDVEKSNVAALDPKTGKWQTVLEGASFARYGGGRLVFLRGASVFSAPFDLSRLVVTGPPAAVSETIVVNPNNGFGQFDVSADGTLAYLEGPPAPEPTTAVLQLDRRGKGVPIPLPPARYHSPRLSPDGKRLMLTQTLGPRISIVVYDRERKVLSPLTPEPGRHFCPVWSGDGKKIAFASMYLAEPRLCLKNADGSGGIETVAGTGGRAEFANSFSPDGEVLAFTGVDDQTRSGDPSREQSDIWLLSLRGDRTARKWFESPFREVAATFSPDGKWMAYVSNESGQFEVYVRPYPGPGGRTQVSSEGGLEPLWTGHGRELLYRTGESGEKFMTVDVRGDPELRVSTPRLLFSADLLAGGRDDNPWQFDVSPDGNEVIALREERVEEPNWQVAIVTNWAVALGPSGTSN